MDNKNSGAGVITISGAVSEFNEPSSNKGLKFGTQDHDFGDSMHAVIDDVQFNFKVSPNGVTNVAVGKTNDYFYTVHAASATHLSMTLHNPSDPYIFVVTGVKVEDSQGWFEKNQKFLFLGGILLLQMIMRSRGRTYAAQQRRSGAAASTATSSTAEAKKNS